MTKKIILLLVEGPTDEDALALIYSKLVKEHELEIDVLHTDITADENMTVKYIEKKIQEEVTQYLQRNPFVHREDILKLVQIIDTDGAFVSSSQIKQSQSGKTEYFDEYVAAKDKDRLIRRNISKRNIVYHLFRTEKIWEIPYEIYYFSRNLEHVLHNLDQNLTDEEKEELDKEFHVNRTYDETWNFIMQDGNSLRRYCNMTVFFEQLGIFL